MFCVLLRRANTNTNTDACPSAHWNIYTYINAYTYLSIFTGVNGGTRSEHTANYTEWKLRRGRTVAKNIAASVFVRQTRVRESIDAPEAKSSHSFNNASSLAPTGSNTAAHEHQSNDNKCLISANLPISLCIGPILFELVCVHANSSLELLTVNTTQHPDVFPISTRFGLLRFTFRFKVIQSTFVACVPIFACWNIHHIWLFCH